MKFRFATRAHVSRRTFDIPMPSYADGCIFTETVCGTTGGTKGTIRPTALGRGVIGWLMKPAAFLLLCSPLMQSTPALTVSVNSSLPFAPPIVFYGRSVEGPSCSPVTPLKPPDVHTGTWYPNNAVMCLHHIFRTLGRTLTSAIFSRNKSAAYV